MLLLIIFNPLTYFTFEITFLFNSQYMLITCKRDLVLYRAMSIVYKTFYGSAWNGSIRGAETCCCYKMS